MGKISRVFSGVNFDDKDTVLKVGDDVSSRLKSSEFNDSDLKEENVNGYDLHISFYDLNERSWGSDFERFWRGILHNGSRDEKADHSDGFMHVGLDFILDKKENTLEVTMEEYYTYQGGFTIPLHDIFQVNIMGEKDSNHMVYLKEKYKNEEGYTDKYMENSIVTDMGKELRDELFKELERIEQGK